MNLRGIIDRMASEHDSLCIVAKKPWGPESEAQLVQLTQDSRVPRSVLEQGFEYFLEVSVALDDVLYGLEEVLTDDQRFNAVLHYAENDAYPEWLCAMRDKANS
jgi:hypothetical protein